jgi:molybdopterin converting factor small subunit
MSVKVFIATTMRSFTNRNSQLELEGNTVNEVIENLLMNYPDAGKALFEDGKSPSDGGVLHQFINIFVNDDNINDLNGLDTKINDNDEITFLPVIAGGAPTESIISDERRKNALLDDKEIDRYSKHLMLREIGVKGQKRIKASKVLIIGLGALGSPIALYLAAAGDTPLDVLCSQTKKSDIIPQGYVEYETEPREYRLSSISTIINVNTAIEDVYSSPYDQVEEQISLAIESLRERQESQLINNDDYGLLKNVADSQRIQTRNGAPTPDDLDELISKVWKEPSFFLAHPRAIAAFERECTKRGVPPVTANIAGGTFILWRGIPIIPTDKLLVDGLKNPKSQSGKTNILLLRTGEAKRGVIGLFQAGLKNEQSRGLTVRYRGIDDKGVASYLLSLYCSAAILADDAIAVLEDVEVGEYYDYE